jgi:hypothetical protein
MAWTRAIGCVSLLIAQLNYSRCSPEHTLRPAPNRPSAELTSDEVQKGCAIATVWSELHLVEIRCPAPSGITGQRYCIDGATIGSFRKKNNLLVNCLTQPDQK